MIVRIELEALEIEVDGRSAAQLDRDIERAMRERHRQAFKACMSGLQTGEQPACACGGTMRSNGMVPHTVETLAGSVIVARRRLRCPSCGLEVQPLDAALPRGLKHTAAVVERGLYLAVEVSYAKASSMMERFFGVSISHGQLHRLALAEGGHVGAGLAKATDDLFGLGLDPSERRPRTSDDTLVVAIDGGAVTHRDADTKYFEAKVGVVYGIRAQVSATRSVLVDRIGYAGVENSEVFTKRLCCLALQQGMRSAGRVLALGDGAPWIRRAIADYFPDAIYLLDLFHLKRYVRRVLAEREDADLLGRVLRSYECGDVGAIVHELSSWRAPSADRDEARRKLVRFVRVNRSGIENYARTDLVGSGAVEKAVDLLVSRRFKSRGMSWLQPGAHSLLKLRLLRFNDEWDEHWDCRIAA